MGDLTHGQTDYDALVTETGCASAEDTLQCLRGVPYEVLKAAIDKSPSNLSYKVSRTVDIRM